MAGRALQLRKQLRAHTVPIAQYLRHNPLAVVIQNAQRHTAEKGKRINMAITPRLSHFAQIGLYKAGI